MTKAQHSRKGAAATVAGAVFVALALPAQGEMRPSLSFSGVPGVIDMPSGESLSDGTLAITSAHFGPVSRTTITFQITPRLSGSFRYMGVRNWDDVIDSDFETYYDRSFDLRYQVLDEGRYTPAVVIGLQDFIGTGLMSGEYLAATKTFGDRVKVTAGIGWGRFGSYQPFATTGIRPPIEIGQGGTAHTGQWFKGDVAGFAGVEWQATEKLGLKLEYSSDNWSLEAGEYGTFERKSAFNFGVEYQVAENLRLGAYYLYGSEFGVALQYALDPFARPTGGLLGAGPLPVRERPAPGAAGWSQEWVTDTGRHEAIRAAINTRLRRDRITLETLTLSPRAAEVRIRVPDQDNAAQVVGRTARALAAELPASVETFRIVPLRRGLALTEVTLQRTDLEALDHAPGQDILMRDRVAFDGATGRPAEGALLTPGLYPKFGWGLSPYVSAGIFDPDNPLRIDAGLRLSATYQIAPGVMLSGAIHKKLLGNLGDSDRVSNSVLPHVRSDSNIYDREGDPSIEHLTAAWYAKPGQNLFSRVTVGYLERMFGGVSAELLWKRPDRPYAIGVEVNYVRQRDFNQMLGFQDYDVLTGHISGYYDFGNGFMGQLDVGRYLAGDVGATISLDREFSNGWKVGAFATFTDVSAEEFGEGSFDKGIRISIPFQWILGQPTQKAYSSTIRPLTRDGGARLSVDGRLYETIRSYQPGEFDDQWGRFWQ